METKNTKLISVSFDDIKNGVFCVPKHVKIIEENVFWSNDRIKKIELNNVNDIRDSAFQFSAIKEVDLSNVKYFGVGVFNYCKQLKNIIWSKYQKSIPQYMFSGCIDLSSIDSKNSIVSIGKKAFCQCKNLTSFENCENLLHIGQGAFMESGIKNIYIPKKILSIGDYAFYDCPSLSKIQIPTTIKKVGYSALPFLQYKRQGDSYICSHNYFSNQKDKNIAGHIEQIIDNDTLVLSPQQAPYVGIILDHWDNKQFIAKELKNEYVAQLFYMLYQKLDDVEFGNFSNTANLDYYKKTIQSLNIRKDAMDSFNLLLYNLGAFQKPITYERISKRGQKIVETIDYSQKIIEFIKGLRKKNYLNDASILRICDGMKPRAFDRDLTDFILQDDNLIKLLNIEMVNKGIIASIFNNFEEIQKTNRNRHGAQRQLKPTIEKFVDYFDGNKFMGVTEDTKELAKELSKFFADQEIFDYAKQIARERKIMSQGKNITRKDVTEKLLSNDDDERTAIVNQIIDNITKHYDKNSNEYRNFQRENIKSYMNSKLYTFEWLDKDSVENYTLGLLTGSCAYPNGPGSSLLRGSIVDPDMQNLVFRDANGNIVGKATMSINRVEGYGLFNNVYINDNVPQRDKDIIYAKFKMATLAFAREYNKENIYHPINMINVGMSSNALANQIRQYDKQANKRGRLIDLSRYDKFGFSYDGDVIGEQYTIWEDKEKEIGQ